jgi:hypothetical protein
MGLQLEMVAILRTQRMHVVFTDVDILRGVAHAMLVDRVAMVSNRAATYVIVQLGKWTRELVPGTWESMVDRLLETF